MRGRKPICESRAAEFRQRLVVWKGTPESLRPSFRALARELGTSHQLLQHYLDGLDEWQARDRYLRAKEGALEKARQIRARAAAENREMTIRECCDAIITPGVLGQIEDLRQKARRGPLHRLELKILQIWAKHFPVAREVLASSRAMTPQEERAERQRVRKARPKISKVRFHEIRLQRLVERFEEIGGVLLPDEGEVCYFIPEESALSRVLVTELVKYREELKSILERNPRKVDFAKVKAEICQRFPSIPLSPLESHRGKRKEAGNSAGTGEEETATKTAEVSREDNKSHAFTVPSMVSQ